MKQNKKRRKAAEEEALAGHREERSSDAQLQSWRQKQRDMLVCESAADGMRVRGHAELFFSFLAGWGAL